MGAREELTVLSILCQKVRATGSGVVVKELADRANRVGVHVVQICAGDDGEDPATLFDPSARIDVRVVRFRHPLPVGLPFPVVGMSNEMPYESMPFCELTWTQVDQYLSVWDAHITAAIEEFEPHVIHIHHLWLLAALVAHRWPGIPKVVSIHGTDLRRADELPHLRALVRPWVSRFGSFLTLTDDDHRAVRARYTDPLPATWALGNGFNDSLFRPSRPVDTDVLAKYGISPGPGQRVVLSVAKYDPTKGIEWLIRAFARAQRDVGGAALLVICGGGPQEERSRYEALGRDLGIGDFVHFTGPVAYEDVGVIMQLAEPFALPAYHEPFGLVILEALASGRRVVTTDQAGPARFIPPSLRASDDVVFVPGLSSLEPSCCERDAFVAAFGGAIARCLAAPTPAPGRRRRIADAVSALSWDRYMRRLAEIYRGVATARVES